MNQQVQYILQIQYIQYNTHNGHHPTCRSDSKEHERQTCLSALKTAVDLLIDWCLTARQLVPIVG